MAIREAIVVNVALLIAGGASPDPTREPQS